MHVKFLNVGHGDSIVLEWDSLGIRKVGIIDCCSHNNSIPTIEYLYALKDFELEFLLLTHPHRDHYSGFLDLLNYIKSNNKSVKYFMHSMSIHPIYLRWTELDEEDAKMLENIFDLVLSLHDNDKIISSIQIINENWQIPIGENHILKSYSPSDDECRHFTAKIDYYSKEHWYICSSASNYLSTIIELENSISKEKCLFTSDATDFSFKRLEKSSISINYFQIPHHGSSKSLYEPFWRNRSFLNPKTGIISAGLHKKYNLPDYMVVKFFHELGTVLRSTNYVNGLKEYFDNFQLITHNIQKALDDFSEQVISSYHASPSGVEFNI